MTSDGLSILRSWVRSPSVSISEAAGVATINPAAITIGQELSRSVAVGIAAQVASSLATRFVA